MTENSKEGQRRATYFVIRAIIGDTVSRYWVLQNISYLSTARKCAAEYR